MPIFRDFLLRSPIDKNLREKVSGCVSRQMRAEEDSIVKHDLVEFKVRCLKVFCYHGNKSISLFNSIFRTTPEVSTKLYFVEISSASEKLWLFNYKRADFLASKFWIFFHFSASLNTAQNFYSCLKQSI